MRFFFHAAGLLKSPQREGLQEDTYLILYQDEYSHLGFCP